MTDTTKENPTDLSGGEGEKKEEGKKTDDPVTPSSSALAAEIAQHLLTALEKKQPSSSKGK